ncbi:MAG: SUMF1/EgtB/PvdO family nonheme iron enzyme, partial [Ktedonobacteraceae bacterium]
FLEEMPSELRKRCPKGFFERHLQKGNCLILLDAFDELGNADARAAMARRIAGFLEIYDWNNNRIVVTTRIVGYEGQLDKFGFSVRTIQSLRAGDIRALVKQRYKVVALAEIAGKQDQESSDINRKLLQRAERLIEKIEDTPRLGQLATNPMLLSLIVLVHSLKVELPEERLLLYRDCVEILTERWQQAKREEAGIKKEDRDELGLSQKLVLLQQIAFVMQQQRKEEGSVALIPKDSVKTLIANRLPDFLDIELPQAESAKKEFLCRKAEAWIESIQSESGILVEQGLDEAGEPLVGFSHLTFQEYLAAVALNENNTYQPILWQNLLQPTWQEVLLMYVALTTDATPVIRALLQSPKQPRGLLLAGQCLAERLKKVETHLQQLILTDLKESFSQADEDTVSDYGNVLAALGKTEVTTFLRTQLRDPSLKKRVAAIKSLGQTRANDPEIEAIREDLTKLLETPNEVEITVTAEEALAQIGDPRFTSLEPRMVRLKIPSFDGTRPLKGRKKPILPLEWAAAKRNSNRFNFMIRRLDFFLWTNWYLIRKQPPQSHEFEIGKYPITNIEYDRFITATGHGNRAPITWKEKAFPQEEATHPVTGITVGDANAFCKWLSSQTGSRYRLPTEWEWEFAAVQSRDWRYPWGEQFDKTRCNTIESGREGTTPVGSYLAGITPEGIFDLAGNAWEHTKSHSIISKFTIHALPLLLFLFIFFISSVIAVVETVITFDISHIFRSLLSLLITSLLVLITVLLTSSFDNVCRGGAWNNSSNETTCYYRHTSSYISIRFIGFRILKEIE